jgi:hypothetical protein
MLALAGRTLGANEKRLLDLMAEITRADEHRQKSYDVITRMLARTGSAPIWLLQVYNESALALLQDQQKIIDLLASLAVPGLSFQAPWPPLFVDRTRSDLSQLKLPPLSEGVLEAENFSVFFQAPVALPSTPTGGVAAAPVLLWWGVVAIGAVAAYFISDNYQAHKTIQLENALAAEVERMRLKAYELQLAQVRWKALFTSVQTAKCGTVTSVLEKVQCFQRAMLAAETTPPPPNLGSVLLDMKKLQLQDALGGHGIFFWVGVSVVTGAVAFGGFKLWKHRDAIRRKLT